MCNILSYIGKDIHLTQFGLSHSIEFETESGTLKKKKGKSLNFFLSVSPVKNLTT